MEFPMNSSAGVLYNRISTPEGLSEWFCENVRVEGERYFFEWCGREEAAFLLSHKKDDHIRFRWEEDEEGSFFQFRIEVDELTGDLVLLISDHIEPEEFEASKELWDWQVEVLKRVLGA